MKSGLFSGLGNFSALGINSLKNIPVASGINVPGGCGAGTSRNNKGSLMAPQTTAMITKSILNSNKTGA